MNIPTLMTKLAAVRGHPIPTSTRSAPDDQRDSEVIPADSTGQIGSARGVRLRRNIEYARRETPGGSVRLRLDLMIPEAGGRHPLVVFVPGGGFVMAPKVGGAKMRRYVAAAGLVVASIEYRTTRHDATFRDGLQDVQDAIRFLRSHADEFGIDPARVGLWGESAGGYLAALAGVVSGDPALDPDGTAAVRAVVDKFGGSDLSRLADGFDDDTVAKINAPGNPNARWVGGPQAMSVSDDVVSWHASDPSRHVRPDAPAFLIFHGSDDRLVSPVQTMVMHQALLNAGARSRRILVAGAGHGDIAVKGGEEKYWTTTAVMQFIVDFLRRELSEGGEAG
ncbi:alpha/beta hydrolase [Microbacterium deminutum]|uniref:BD-FAE-like domain-containing protein n=1 Tax=Microbacterium deminutum TaxID=344164 RepID=A0ABP5BE14_9MICO